MGLVNLFQSPKTRYYDLGPITLLHKKCLKKLEEINDGNEVNQCSIGVLQSLVEVFYIVDDKKSERKEYEKKIDMLEKSLINAPLWDQKSKKLSFDLYKEFINLISFVHGNQFVEWKVKDMGEAIKVQQQQNNTTSSTKK